ncbi:Guanosine-diphosphatase [Brettanomyces nanus]|uniref:guanosine-diphosphatase n=1 Tax=Eeniella nana TaxID=13502 RepID=A0A875S3T1_EENNA|nr:Guanosine-diphosphatase [Brettanomyces nanus]QPG75976.1 Guanosine-diphosphatase [Brettanomyces nanus]
MSAIRKSRLFVVGASLIIGLIIFLSIPSQRVSAISSSDDQLQRADVGYGISLKPEKSLHENYDVNSKDSEHGTTSSGASSSGASSSCTEKKEYVVMIDAGSTGSRVHVYTFDTCFSPPKLLDEQFKMLKPGLSSFDKDTIGAAKSLDPLLQVALDTIPSEERGCSPVSVKATAGLRLLGQEKSDAILQEVRSHLENDFPFPVVSGDGISIMDGGDEGVYAWITSNYLLGNIGSDEKLPTAAVFDLGGGSTQIVFEPVDGEKMIEGEHKYKIDFGGRSFVLYQYSHLGYGLMQGRQKINALVLDLLIKRGKVSNLKPLTESQMENVKTLRSDITIKHPCVPPGVTAENVKVEMEDGSAYLVNFVSPAENESDPLAATASTQCRFLAESVLNKDADCESKSCSFNGIYQPSLRHQFPVGSDMFVFSYFYDRLKPIGMPTSFSLQEMLDLTQLVCSGSSIWNEFFLQKTTINELQDEPLWCLDLSFMTTLLHTGYTWM